MGFGGTRLCVCLLLAFAVISSAQNTVLFSDDEVVMAMEMEGRSLRVTTNDYDDPTANRGHDPSAFASSRVKSGGGGGRKG
ncbi:protein PSY3 [Pyrus x bretschneideri]|uniref:protein PSY3 n=1 Tax=Pyrus x bretschneideri TaxID=225117 RepID=UPI002030FCCE|nr:protein PSY3 [Pyrus x bretschneideri]